MANLIEKSFLMALGAAVLTKEMAEGVVDELVKKGEDTGTEGRKVVEETVESARQQTRTLKKRLDESMERNFHDAGLVTSDQLDDLKLKIAQLEHRLSLLESSPPVKAPATGGVTSTTPLAEEELPSGAAPSEVSEAYHHIREEDAEAEALNPHLDVP